MEKIAEAETKLYEKGYYVDRMAEPCDNNYFEVYDKDCNTLIDWLSAAQLIQLANML